MWNLRRNVLLIVTIFAGTLIQVSNGFEWTASSPPDGSTVETCVGEKVSLHWQYSITAEETVMNVEWHKSTGDGKTILATHLSGHLLKFPNVHATLTFLPNAGLEMGNFTLEDYTTYFVTVHYTRDGSFFSRSRSVTLVLPDAPVLTDRRLVANIQPEVVIDVTTGQLHVQLACGKFQKLGSRPVSVMWLTPSGAKVPSTSYANGTFHLTLPNPVQGGGYQCQLKDPSLVARCVRDMSTFMRGSYVHVDEVQVRLLLLEGGVKGLGDEDHVAHEELHRLAEVAVNLTSRDDRLTSDVSDLQSRMGLQEEADRKVSLDVQSLQDGLAKQRALCPDDFPLKRGDSCYSISIDKKNFMDAKAACAASGGKLVEIETPGENEFLKLYVRLDGEVGYWLGGSDLDTEGTFVWESDKRPLTFTDWAPGQPDNYKDLEDCMEIRLAYQARWNDANCQKDKTQKYICEKSRS